ncbi:MAG: porin [Colwellia sp.]|jgi:Outer membrane protein (porin)
MKNTSLKSVLLPLALALPVFSTQAADDVTKAELQSQFNEIKIRLSQLEQGKVATAAESNTDVSFYGTLRPTFGVTSTDDRDDWDVGDALSRIGVALEHKLSNGMTGFAKGEFKIQIQGDAHFGDTRKAYVGIKGDFGRVAIGKQETTSYAVMGAVDIFDRTNTPLAYDDIGVFRKQELVSYRKSFGNLEVRGEAQFSGEDKENEGSDLFNAGVRYTGSDYTVGFAYLTRDFAGEDENSIAVAASKSIGDWYLAAAYGGFSRDVVNGDTTTIDLVASYAINSEYKVLFGASQFDDQKTDADSNDVNRFNTTLEWQGTKDFRLFVEYQHNDFEYQDAKDSDQLTVGMRYNFNYNF